MCGRFVSATPPDELARYFGAETFVDPGDPGDPVGPRFNIAPSASVYTVIETEEARRIETAHWGLLPIWAKEKRVGYRMFNARAETLAEKSAFKRSFAKRRCLIPADGFYEWKVLKDEPGSTGTGSPGDTGKPNKRGGNSKPAKQPVFIHRADGEPFAFAGLWDVWRGPERKDPPLVSCTIITGEPNEKMADYHDRMPVMLPPSAWDTWLDPTFADLGRLQEFFVPAPSSLLEIYPVSTEVNNARNQGDHLANPLADPEPDVTDVTDEPSATNT